MKLFGSLCALVILLGACETDPIISIPSKPIPVVYAVLDDLDSTHRIIVTKSFGAKYNPAAEASIYDSLFFKDLRVEVDYLPFLQNRNTQWESCEVYKIKGQEKDSGFFSYPISEYYQFDLVLREWEDRYVDSIQIKVIIPGYDDVIGKIRLTDSIRITTPKFNQQYIYLTPNSTLKIHWDNSDPWVEPHAWSEIDVGFEFIEELDSGFRSRWVHFQNTQYFLSPYGLYRELSITYEEFIKGVLQQIPDDKEVIERTFGYIYMDMSGGDSIMMQYKKYLEGYSDYNFGGFSNIQNGYGIFSSATRFYKDSMRFDFDTRQILINERRLKWMKLNPWAEE